jgi:hypothetical protein
VAERLADGGNYDGGRMIWHIVSLSVSEVTGLYG